MSTSSRLTGVLNSSEEILFDSTSKFTFFSDIHRGDNSEADNFAPNSAIFSSALEYYFTNGFTYIEIGDSDELWENDHFTELFKSHRDIYMLIRKFHRENRLFMLWGNHDIVKRRKRFVHKNLYKYYDETTGKHEPLFDNIKIREGLVLKYRGTPHSIFVVHGHQGDLLNDRLWPLARFLVRHIWRRIEFLRIRNPISPARNFSLMSAIENRIIHWANTNSQMIITGHTHHPVFPRPGEAPYFNDGCCVREGYITGIEIQNNEIMLVRWSRKPGNQKTPDMIRDIIAGPEKLEAFFNSKIQ